MSKHIVAMAHMGVFQHSTGKVFDALRPVGFEVRADGAHVVPEGFCDNSVIAVKGAAEMPAKFVEEARRQKLLGYLKSVGIKHREMKRREKAMA